MKINFAEKLSNKLVKAFLKNKIVSPLPLKFTKQLKNADKFRKLCESKVNDPIIGFKAGGTALPVMKKLKEKEPFYASVYKRNFLKNGKAVKINKSTLGIELEVCYLIKKEFFDYKKALTIKNIGQFISHIAACIEVVGYRQRKKGIKSFGDLCSDFGGNIKFIIGKKKKYKKINIGNCQTILENINSKQKIFGNTNTVYINPLNSLKFVLGKLKNDKVTLNKNFFVFTGSTVGVVPISAKGLFIGKINKVGRVQTYIK